MKDFMKMVETEINSSNKSITENGAVGYGTSGEEMVDFNFKIPAFRHMDDSSIYDEFKKFYASNKTLAMRYAFYLRDREQGIGERKIFRAIINGLANDYPNDVRKVLKYIPEFGRWDDMFGLVDTEVKNDMLSRIAVQLGYDGGKMENGESISLLAKWMPSENTSSVKTKNLATKIRKELGLNSKEYRKMLSSLRGYLKVVETKMSANKWDEIDYNAVPSKANVVYSNAFLNHDRDRRVEFLESLKRNDGSAKINAGVLFPHDVVHKYSCQGWKITVDDYDETLEQLWKNLPDFVEGNSNTLVVRDGSGSMTVNIDNKSRTSALEVATALTIYFSERASGVFKDRFITFSSKPKMIDLNGCENLHDKLFKCYAEDDCSNTDIEATFDIILQTAIDNDLSQDELPKNVLIVSDMEFDTATYDRRSDYKYDKALFETISAKFAQYGYKMPRLVFWNVNSRTNTIPLQNNELGLVLISGFSSALCTMVCSEEISPIKALISAINSERYQCIEDAMN